MPRWEPNAQQRLERAALELFAERGYDGTTVADIAERAGLMKRSFFRYFHDKREVLFSGTEPLVAHLEEQVGAAPAATPPWPVLLAALTSSARIFPADRDLPRKRQSVIAANPELREREVLKTTALQDVLRAFLATRGVPEPQAVHLVRLALSVYEQAFQEWLAPGATAAFADCMARAAAELDRALCRYGPAAADGEPAGAVRA